MDKPDRIKPLRDTLESFTDVQFRKSSATPQCQSNKGPDLVELL